MSGGEREKGGGKCEGERKVRKRKMVELEDWENVVCLRDLFFSYEREREERGKKGRERKKKWRFFEKKE